MGSVKLQVISGFSLNLLQRSHNISKWEEGIFLLHCVCIRTIEDKMKLQLLMNSLNHTKILRGGMALLPIGLHRTPKAGYDSVILESNLNFEASG